jgi:hypothetical protein
LIVLTLGVCTVIGCDFQYSEASTINQKIRVAQAEMEREEATRRTLAHAAKTQRPYVLAILPTEGVTQATIASLDVPREAKMWLAMEVENRAFDGHLIGILEADKAEWQPLADGVAADKLVYVWKQPGDELTIELTMIGGRTLITSLR